MEKLFPSCYLPEIMMVKVEKTGIFRIVERISW
jgi:hypothetical protein